MHACMQTSNTPTQNGNTHLQQRRPNTLVKPRNAAISIQRTQRRAGACSCAVLIVDCRAQPHQGQHLQQQQQVGLFVCSVVLVVLVGGGVVAAFATAANNPQTRVNLMYIHMGHRQTQRTLPMQSATSCAHGPLDMLCRRLPQTLHTHNTTLWVVTHAPAPPWLLLLASRRPMHAHPHCVGPPSSSAAAAAVAGALCGQQTTHPYRLYCCCRW